MNYVFVLIEIYVVIHLLVLVLKQRAKIRELENQNKILRQDVSIAKDMEIGLKGHISYLQGYIERLETAMQVATQVRRAASKIPPDALGAVKYAMKHSHPDNGGSAEDFMRFQKIYEELTRK